MKRLLLIAILVIPQLALAQEFVTYKNGLIYSPETMQKLGVIVDSLNVRYRHCEPKTFHSILQGEATFVALEKNDEARKDIQRGMSFEEFKAKHPKAIREEHILISRYEYFDYSGVRTVRYNGFCDDCRDVTVTDRSYFHKASGWVTDQYNACFIHNLQSTTLPEEYAKLVMYVDCMVDTTAEIYTGTKDDKNNFRFSYHKPGPIHSKFLAIASDHANRPRFPDYTNAQKSNKKQMDSIRRMHIRNYLAWDSMRIVKLDERIKTDSTLMRLLNDATTEAIADTSFDESLEYYIARYLSKEKALEMKRSRRVMGACSMDSRPRNHAVGICMLAAETAQWDIFLRSHLDIMNDRFERMSDGSYAWAQRKTYLKELEELDIHAVDLLLGTCLRVTPTATEHYWGSVNRVGRALADVADKDALELRLQKMIADSQLDLYNRVLMIYLYANYIHNLDDAPRKTANKKTLDKLIKTFPDSVKTYCKPFGRS